MVVVVAVAALGIGGVFWSCARTPGRDTDCAQPSKRAGDGRVDGPAKGAVPVDLAEEAGQVHTLNASGRAGAYFLPAQRAGQRIPLFVGLHGTGARGQDMVEAFRQLARSKGFAIVAPDSRRSPAGEWTWEAGSEPHEETNDLQHVIHCVDEILGRFPDRIDGRDALIAGHSGGGSSAPYVATRRGPFGVFAVMHGGIVPRGLGDRRVRGWFSTGAEDTLRPPAMVREAATEARAHGLQVEYREFAGGHDLSLTERQTLIEWWFSQR
jgi:predicted esterase